MTPQDKHLEISRAVDTFILRERFDEVALTADNKYQIWYGTLLSTIALLIAGEEVIYAHCNYEPGMRDIRIVVFTTNLVLVADVDVEADGVPVAQVAQRRSLVRMKLSTSEKIDARDGHSREWPGVINLVLTFRDFTDPIEIVANGVNMYALDKPSPIVTLVEGLSADLANRL